MEYSSIKLQKEFFKSKKTYNINFRINVLKDIRELLIKYKEQFYDAFKKDFNKCEFDVITTEFSLVLEEINYFIKNTKKLSKEKNVCSSIINFPSKSKIYKDPYGLVLIISPWNYPLLLSLQPLIGAISAGNTVILKPSNISENVSNVIFNMFKDYNHPEIIDVILGGRRTVNELINEDVNYIFFTGGENAGKQILEKASNYLIPNTLELGGKSPTIVLDDCSLDITCKRIVWGKFLNAGQTCVAPDYVFVDEKIYNKFIDKCIYYIKKFYYKDGKINDDFPYIINEKHLNRLLSLIDNNKLAFGGNNDNLLLEPTILKDVDILDDIMKEEIFGPILPVLKYSSVNDVLDYIKSRPNPLACYIFTKDIKYAKKLMKFINFGGGCINDTIMHLTSINLPFGGVGQSGMGNYHGKYSFNTFSREKAILIKNKKEIKIKYPPYSNNKYRIIKKLFKM